MKRLYLIRHAESLSNIQDIMIGSSQGELTENGKGQAQMLASHLTKFRIDLIISSSLQRAMDTARLINKKLNIPLGFTTLLNERALGELTGIRREDYQRLLTDQTDKLNFRPKGGESFMDVSKRVKQFLVYVLTLREENILIVTHGRFLKILLNHIQNKSILEEIKQDNCCLNIISFDEGFRIETQNFTFTDKTNHYAGAIIPHKDRLLLGLRPNIPTIKSPGLWSTFGGRVEDDETIEEALKREIKEELGVEVRELNLFLEYPHLEFPDILRHTFICELEKNNDSEFIYSEELCSRWFSRKELNRHKLSPSTAYCIKTYFDSALSSSADRTLS
jgi:broad specificity phosphatase PhoE/8-oxo-dGTP pyrophosphatase MutT (NUDIX family)